MLLEATILLRDYLTEPMILKLPSTSQSNVEKVKRKEEGEYASGGNNSPKRLSSRTDDSEVADHVVVC
ncbi:hypothetical protein R3W88_004115 [Solanum pinnatisectum]|uniref:Uncharacterized protein n=1 Tax=Solanum pinnatisectum TaxID=50273 RepID=A0AAV9MRH3_9SOLN|nr:hypothetical protein R3W88_004115 [Solanum pinnatisectum]